MQVRAPEAGPSRGADGQAQELAENKSLLRGFFVDVQQVLLPHGEVHVTHKTVEPFSWWRIIELALECGLQYEGGVVFDRYVYPGYVNRKVLDKKSFPCNDARTYVFTAPAATAASAAVSAAAAVAEGEEDGDEKLKKKKAKKEEKKKAKKTATTTTDTTTTTTSTSTSFSSTFGKNVDCDGDSYDDANSSSSSSSAEVVVLPLCDRSVYKGIKAAVKAIVADKAAK
jgi:hypothetical protein